MRVEIIERTERSELQNAVNRILSAYSPSDIIDIKYSITGKHASYSSNRYSAMIIFK